MVIMCDKCKPHAKHWIHIADRWTEKEKKEMLDYLQSNNRLALYSIGIGK